MGQQIPSDITLGSIKKNSSFYLGDNDLDNNIWGINENENDDGDDNDDFSLLGDNDQVNQIEFNCCSFSFIMI